MNIPWMAGNADDFREKSAPMGTGEALLLHIASASGPDLHVLDQNLRISRGERQ